MFSHGIENMSVVVSKQKVAMDCTFQYFLRVEDLALLHDTFDLQYEDILRTNAIDAIKSSVTQFSTRDFGTIRDVIEETLYQAVRARLGGMCCPIWCDSPGGKIWFTYLKMSVPFNI